MLQGSDLGLYGQTPSLIPSSNPQSTLHYESSINDEPDIPLFNDALIYKDELIKLAL